MSEPRTRLRRLTVEEWAALPEDEPGELVDGVLVDEEMPGLAHETVVAWLIETLRGWIRPRGGFVFGSEAKFAVARARGRKPDVTVYLPGRGRLPAEGAVRLPPDVVIEVISQTPRDRRRDRIEKAGDYAAFGVPWYWLVDYGLRTLEVMALGAGGRYLEVVSAARGRLDPVPGCEGLGVDLDALWAEVDRLAPGEG